MKLLIDEMYPAAIARPLRDRGHDVQAVVERPDLRSLSDADVLAAAQAEARAVVTENVRDFPGLADQYDREGRPHHGVVLVSAHRFHRGSPRTIGRMVTALDALLRHRPDDEPHSLRHWL